MMMVVLPNWVRVVRSLSVSFFGPLKGDGAIRLELVAPPSPFSMVNACAAEPAQSKADAIRAAQNVEKPRLMALFLVAASLLPSDLATRIRRHGGGVHNPIHVSFRQTGFK